MSSGQQQKLDARVTRTTKTLSQQDGLKRFAARQRLDFLPVGKEKEGISGHTYLARERAEILNTLKSMKRGFLNAKLAADNFAVLSTMFKKRNADFFGLLFSNDSQVGLGLDLSEFGFSDKANVQSRPGWWVAATDAYENDRAMAACIEKNAPVLAKQLRGSALFQKKLENMQKNVNQCIATLDLTKLKTCSLKNIKDLSIYQQQLKKLSGQYESCRNHFAGQISTDENLICLEREKALGALLGQVNSILSAHEENIRKQQKMVAELVDQITNLEKKADLYRKSSGQQRVKLQYLGFNANHGLEDYFDQLDADYRALAEACRQIEDLDLDLPKLNNRLLCLKNKFDRRWCPAHEEKKTDEMLYSDIDSSDRLLHQLLDNGFSVQQRVWRLNLKNLEICNLSDENINELSICQRQLKSLGYEFKSYRDNFAGQINTRQNEICLLQEEIFSTVLVRVNSILSAHEESIRKQQNQVRTEEVDESDDDKEEITLGQSAAPDVQTEVSVEDVQDQVRTEEVDESDDDKEEMLLGQSAAPDVQTEVSVEEQPAAADAQARAKLEEEANLIVRATRAPKPSLTQKKRQAFLLCLLLGVMMGGLAGVLCALQWAPALTTLTYVSWGAIGAGTGFLIGAAVLAAYLRIYKQPPSPKDGLSMPLFGGPQDMTASADIIGLEAAAVPAKGPVGSTTISFVQPSAQPSTTWVLSHRR